MQSGTLTLSNSNTYTGTTVTSGAPYAGVFSAGTLVLNGDGAGPVNNFAVISQVALSYAPPGKPR